MKTDNKRTFVLIGLVAVLFAVGAFQVIGGMAKPVVKVTSKPAKDKQDEAQKPKQEPNPQELMALAHPSLPPRDPFTPQVVEPDPVASNSNATPTLGTPNPPQEQAAPRPVRSSDFRPGPMTGSVPVEPLPLGAAPTLGAAPGPINLSKAAPLRQPDEFGYSVKGVIVGQKPLAVFEDAQGNQLLVPLGGSVGSDSKLLGIERGKVKIRHRGKDKTLALSE
ncbi:MAG: hypothetical protein KF884_00160 [Fimbriimonadaceae bacterium]|nr:hypothetical protein [Fimbriimonadaceae bacterium]QYK58508.1 MAG: hypothetical protein KF884_00160 [Fimbriimonadaceae bacterium]